MQTLDQVKFHVAMQSDAGNDLIDLAIDRIHPMVHFHPVESAFYLWDASRPGLVAVAHSARRGLYLRYNASCQRLTSSCAFATSLSEIMRSMRAKPGCMVYLGRLPSPLAETAKIIDKTATSCTDVGFVQDTKVSCARWTKPLVSAVFLDKTATNMYSERMKVIYERTFS